LLKVRWQANEEFSDDQPSAIGIASQRSLPSYLMPSEPPQLS
jgi:hypothetical protein